MTVPPSPSLSRVLVVIPCLDEEAHLPGLLDQLVADGGHATIVVADGGSADRSREIVAAVAARHPSVHLLDNPRRIQSAGINLAAQRFGRDHDWLVRIDAHCGYPAGYAAGLLAAARAHDATSVVVPMVTEGRGGFQRGVAAAQNSVLGNGGSLHRNVRAGRFVDHGHHALMRLDAFLAIGGYDETFSHNEDAELDRRLTDAGGRIWLEPGLALTYYPRAAFRPLLRQYAKYGEGRARTAWRHRMPLKLRQAIPLAIAPVVALALIGVVLLPFAPIAGTLMILPAAAWGAACVGYGLMLAVRARSAAVAWSGPAAMAMHLGWSYGFLRARILGLRPGDAPKSLTLLE